MYGTKSRILRACLLASVSAASLSARPARADSVTVATGQTLSTATQNKLSGSDAVVIASGATYKFTSTASSAFQWAGAAAGDGIRIANDGTISGATNSFQMLINGATGGVATGSLSIVNSGLITNNTTILGLGQVAAGSSIVLNNSGTISNTGSTTINTAVMVNGTAQSFQLGGVIANTAVMSNTSLAVNLTVTNSGTMNGVLRLSGGTDTVNLTTASVITGGITGFATANNTVNLSGSGTGFAFGASEMVQPIAGSSIVIPYFYGWDDIQTLNVNSGTWTLLGSGRYNTLNVASGATFNICAAGITDSCGSGYTGTNSPTITVNGTPIAQSGKIIGGGVGPLSGNTLTIVNDGTINNFAVGNSTNYDPASNGAYQVSGTGTFVLNGGLVYVSPTSHLGQGAVRVAAGTLVNAGAMAATVTVDPGASFQLGSGGLKNTSNVAVDDGSTGSLTGNIIDNGAVVLAATGTPHILAGNISGTGSLTVSSFAWTLTGINSYSGGTTVNAGAALFVNPTAGSSAIAAGNILNNGSIELIGASGYTFSSNVTGAGDLVFTPNGSPTIVITGNLMHTGLTEFAPDTGTGILQVGNGGTSGTLSNNSWIQLLGTLAFNRSDTYTFAAPIRDELTSSGAIASVSQIGSGTTILSANETYTGTTNVNAGTLVLTGSSVSPTTTVANGATFQLGNGGSSGALTGAIIDNGTVVFNRSDSYSYAGLLSGGGLLNQAGGGVTSLTNTANTFSGSVRVSAGTLRTASGFALTAVTTITVDAGATLTQAGTNSIVLFGGAPTTGGLINAGTLSGSGILVNLINSSQDSRRFTGGAINITNSGTISDSANAPAIGLTNALPAGTNVSIVNSGLIANTLANSVLTINGTTQQVQYPSFVILSGGAANTTLTNSGTIRGSVLLGSGSNVINLVTGQTITGRVVGWSSNNNTVNLSGTGSGVVRGASESPLDVTAISTNYFTFYGMDNIQTLNVNSGNWSLVGAGKYSRVTVAGGATFNICGDGVTATCASDYSPAAPGGMPANNGISSMALGGTLTVVNVGVTNIYGSAATISYDVSSNAYKTTISGGGTINLAGPGWLYLSPGSTIAQSIVHLAGGRLIDAGSITATVTVDSGAILQIGSNGALNSNGAAADSGTTGNLIGNVTNNGQVIFGRSDAVAYTGTVSGTGALTVASGRAVLTGSNNYSGGTTINSGAILQVGNGGTTGSVNGNILDNGQLVFNRSDSGIYSGTISGSGGFVLAGGAALTLTGNNTYSGATTIVTSTLQVGSGGTNGSLGSGVVNNGGLLSFNRSDAITISNAIGGSGGVTQLGSGTLSLTGSNTYTGATNVNAGTLLVSGTLASSSGVNVASGATLSGSGTVANTSLASGGILAPGNGGLGALAIAGDLTLASGSVTNIDVSSSASDLLSVNGAASLDGILTASFAAGTYDAKQYTLLTAVGTLSGTFANLNLINLPTNFAASLGYDSHNVYLNFVSNFTLGQVATIDTGTVNVTGNQTTAGLSGSGGTINTSGGSLTVTQSSDTSFAGNITGSGTLTVSGGGDSTLVLTGNSSSFTGTTSITGGTLQIGSSANPNASLGGTVAVSGGTLQVGDANAPGATLNGSVTVDPGGTLEGHGTITGSVTNAGTTAPGGSIGTLHIGGNYTFAAGSLLEQEVAANGTTDLLQADGAVTIASGSSIQVQPGGSAATYGRVTNYTIVTGAGSISGTFTNVSSSAASLTPILSYGPKAVTLALVRNDISLGTLTSNRNAAAAGNAISGAPNSALFAALAPNSDAAVGAALNQLSGEIHASAAGSLLNDGGFLADAVQSLGEGSQPLRLWGHEQRRWTQMDGDGNAAPGSGYLNGFAAGIDAAILDGMRLGAALGYSSASLKVQARDSRADIDSTHVGIYYEAKAGGLAALVAATYAWNNLGTFRNVTFGSVNQSESASYNGTSTNIFGEIRYRLDLTGLTAEPFASIDATALDTDAFSESNGLAALRGGAASRSVIFSTFGARLATTYTFEGGSLEPHISLGWQMGSNDLTAQQGLAFANGPAFIVSGAPLSRSAFATGAGLRLTLGRIGVDILYRGRLGDRVTQNALQASLNASF
jgi:autotransporter-associated beta strand protein